MNGVIICGYPGVGKTTIAGRDNIVDLESSNFKSFGPPDCSQYWVEQYGRVALDLAKQGYIVLCSTHGKVIEWMHNHAPEMRRLGVHGPFLVYPDKTLKYHWITKLLRRFWISQTTKNYRAYKRAKDNFDEDIAFLDSYSSSHTYAIHDAENYNLKSIVKEICNRTESVIVQTNLVDNELWQEKGN